MMRKSYFNAYIKQLIELTSSETAALGDEAAVNLLYPSLVWATLLALLGRSCICHEFENFCRWQGLANPSKAPGCRVKLLLCIYIFRVCRAWMSANSRLGQLRQHCVSCCTEDICRRYITSDCKTALPSFVLKGDATTTMSRIIWCLTDGIVAGDYDWDAVEKVTNYDHIGRQTMQTKVAWAIVFSCTDSAHAPSQKSNHSQQ